MKGIRRLLYMMKNALCAPMGIAFLLISIVMGVRFSRYNTLLGGLYRYQEGVPYLFQEPVDLKRVIEWMLPHVFLSIMIGRQTEESLGVARYELPRYKSVAWWWTCLNVSACGIIVAFYLMVFGVPWGISFLRDAQYDPKDFALWLTITGQAIFTMVALMTMQIGVHVCSRSSIVAAVPFFVIVLASVFWTDGQSVRYLMGNWMMYARSYQVIPEVGYILCVVICGNVFLVVVLHACIYVFLRHRKVLW